MRPTFRLFSSLPIIRLSNATFRQIENSSPNAPIFRNLSFELPSITTRPEVWAVVGSTPEERYEFLRILRGQLIADPPNSRTYPYLSTLPDEHSRLRLLHNAIQYVGFDSERGSDSLRGSYLSARYESRKELTDYTLHDYLLNKTQLNVDDSLLFHPDSDSFSQITSLLQLGSLLKLPVSNLSNGQKRRANVAKALVQSPKVLLLNNPFTGLDPIASANFSNVLDKLSHSQFPRLVLALNLNQPLPGWVTHVVFLRRGYRVECISSKYDVAEASREAYQKACTSTLRLSPDDAAFIEDTVELFDKDPKDKNHRWFQSPANADRHALWYSEHVIGSFGTKDGVPVIDHSISQPGDTMVEMSGVQLRYGDRTVVGDWIQQTDTDVESKQSPRPGLWWKIRRGERWGLFGTNGSGKTTLTALMSSDHPQAYCLPIKMFNKPRLASTGQPAISIFDLQKRIGLCSPELQGLFPKHLTVRQVLESAWAETPLSPVTLNSEVDELVDSNLRWFQGELCPEIGHCHLFREDREDRAPNVSRKLLNKATENFHEYKYNPEHLEWAEELRFDQLSFPSQRLLLFLRAVIKSPDLVILDEPYSGLDAEAVRKCNDWLAYGESKVLVLKKRGRPVISKPRSHSNTLSKIQVTQFSGLTQDQSLVFICHRREEVPHLVREWIRLPKPDSGEPPTFGRFKGPMQADPNRWRDVWGLTLHDPNIKDYRPRLEEAQELLTNSNLPNLNNRRVAFPDPDSVWRLSYSEIISIIIKRQSWNSETLFDITTGRKAATLWGSRVSKYRLNDPKDLIKACEEYITYLKQDLTRSVRGHVGARVRSEYRFIQKQSVRRSLKGFAGYLISRCSKTNREGRMFLAKINSRLHSPLNSKQLIQQCVSCLNSISYIVLQTRTLMTIVQYRLEVVEAVLFQVTQNVQSLKLTYFSIIKVIEAGASSPLTAKLLQRSIKVFNAGVYRIRFANRQIAKLQGRLIENAKQKRSPVDDSD